MAKGGEFMNLDLTVSFQIINDEKSNNDTVIDKDVEDVIRVICI